MSAALVTTRVEKPVLLFDGHCNFCRGGADQLIKLSRGALELVSFQEPGVLDRFPGLTHEACMQAMQLVDRGGQVHSGVAAVVQGLSARWFGPVLKLYYLPGIRQLSDLLYKQVAKARYRLRGKSAPKCENGACELHFK